MRSILKNGLISLEKLSEGKIMMMKLNWLSCSIYRESGGQKIRWH